VNGALELCPVQTECGGCPLMLLELPVQRARKVAALERALVERGIEAGAIELSPSPLSLGYRNRVRLRIDAGHVVFFNAHKALSCAVLVPELRACVDLLRALSEREPGLLAPFTQLELRSPDALGRPGLALGLDGEPRETRSALERLAQALPGFVIGVRGEREIACQQRRFDGGWALVPLDAFWQINDGVNGALVRHVSRQAAQAGARRALDLYAGAGNFALALAAAGVQVTAVEQHEPALAALARAAAAQGFDARGLVGDAALVAERLADDGASFDLVVVDAPRAGARAAIAALARLAPARVLMCSCNTATLSRDLALLVSAGYRLDGLHAFDMFPHTRHLEVVAALSRGSGR
jgi:23S rRNA (uracil1939-C5)-methyltransferase